MTGWKLASDVTPAVPTPPADRPKRSRVRTIGALAALIVIILMSVLPGRSAPRNSVFDLYQRLHPRDLGAMKSQVVEIDSESLRLIGPWPWSRYDLARLTERIGEAGAVAIGFDMVFPEADRQSPALFARRYPELPAAARDSVLGLPSLDDDFAGVLGRYPTVLARAGVTEHSTDYTDTPYQDAAQLPVDATFAAKLPASVASWPQAIASIPEIEETSLGHGLINGDPDRDGVVRRVPAIGSLHGTANIGFAMELARIALDLPGVELMLARGNLAGVKLGTRIVPVRPDGRFLLHFGEVPPHSITSAAQIFRRGFDSKVFAGKVIVIGVTGAGGTDVVTTPLQSQGYGLHVQAQAVDAILRGGWLERPAWAPAFELTVGALLALLAVLLFPRLQGRWIVGVPIALVAFVLGGSWFGFVRLNLLIDPVTPLLIGGAAGVAVAVTLFGEAAAERRRLRFELLEERLGAARAAGEMTAAHNIQVGMLPPHASLAALDPAIDLDALLEPARSIGGDFYDAFRLADGRIVFLVGDVTGKGVPAALFMALSKALSRSALERRQDDLAAAVALLSTELARDNAEDMFVTMLIGVIDGASGMVTLVNAGHENPLIVRGDGRIEEFAMEGGPPVCAAEDFPYEAESFALAAGEGLLLVTDGVTEAQNEAGAFFDRARTMATLDRLAPDWTAKGATELLTRAVRDFEAGAEPSDDLTVMALRRR
jgi:serine phosphatase RsbU (regulator of sigma subunit)/CHASE2 domain-containing sensor protein